MMWLLKIPGIAKIGTIVAAIGAALAGIFLFGASKKREGQKAERTKQTEKINEKVADAKRAVDKLNADPDGRKRLRKRRQRPY